MRDTDLVDILFVLMMFTGLVLLIVGTLYLSPGVCT